jgi:predicted RNA binding protein YcfA (HicA-like mRNA interferase family)
LSKIKDNPKCVKFKEMQTLLEQSGWVLDRISGSHHLYKNPSVSVSMNIQNKNGLVAEYQVKQFLRIETC